MTMLSGFADGVVCVLYCIVSYCIVSLSRLILSRWRCWRALRMVSCTYCIVLYCISTQVDPKSMTMLAGFADGVVRVLYCIVSLSRLILSRWRCWQALRTVSCAYCIVSLSRLILSRWRCWRALRTVSCAYCIVSLSRLTLSLWRCRRALRTVSCAYCIVLYCIFIQVDPKSMTMLAGFADGVVRVLYCIVSLSRLILSLWRCWRALRTVSCAYCIVLYLYPGWS